MHQDENANPQSEQPNRGGAAPEQRRCHYIKADGKGCRDWAHRGQKFCYRHGVFLHAGRGVDVPLLEDEASIVLVLSETLRSLAHGTIALANAHLLLDGCRLAHTMHVERVKAANAERSRRRAEEREARSQEPGAGSQEREAGSRKHEAGNQEPNQEPNQERSAPSSEPCALSSVPCSVPCAEMTDMFAPDYEEERGEVLAAQAERLGERMEEELAVGVR